MRETKYTLIASRPGGGGGHGLAVRRRIPTLEEADIAMIDPLTRGGIGAVAYVYDNADGRVVAFQANVWLSKWASFLQDHGHA